MVDYYTIVEIIVGLCFVLLSFAFNALWYKLPAVKLWVKSKTSPRKNYGSIDVHAPSRTYTFVVSWNQPFWEEFKDKDTGSCHVFVNPLMLKQFDDKGNPVLDAKGNPVYEKNTSAPIRNRWGCPYAEFDITNGAQPLLIKNGYLQAAADPKAINNLLMEMKGVYESKESAKKQEPKKTNWTAYAVYATFFIVLAIGYFVYTNHQLLTSLAPAAQAATNSASGSGLLAGIVHP